ncbi:lysine-specific demethylase 8 [Lingula anatina]|uniref:JmjC domain-containing protein 5 n=1 Tax=Lingula anatina TaxID=7574 RepID=A0A1S3JNW9_LINAN|nr:lysine-specific demethylase 8 [Lingula anatina]|eukprot:XP_013411836.1 lysine-specific demethylase 8 [Lingula anatina]
MSSKAGKSFKDDHIFHQLPPSVQDKIPKDIASLGLGNLDTDVLGEAYSYKLQQCALLLYDGKTRQCSDSSNALLNMAWEMLHTGHWKDVDINWRHSYTYCSLFKCLCEILTHIESTCTRTGDGLTGSYQTAINICDMGLLMGAPVLDNILRRLASALTVLESHNVEKMNKTVTCEEANVDAEDNTKNHKKMKLYKEPDISEENAILRISCPSLEYFSSHHMETETPVIVTDAIDYWPAFNDHKWTLDYLKKVAGCRTVPVEIGSKYTDESWSETLITLQNFIENFIENPSKNSQQNGVGYLAQHQLFDQIPELQRDISIPTYCCLSNSNQGDSNQGDSNQDDEEEDGNEDVDVNAWFGPAGTVSPLHQDPKHNLLAQVVGHKYLKLYSVDDTLYLYPHEGMLSNTSRVDAENPDLENYPLVSQATPMECVLHPGEMLYIPPKCWHYVRSLTLSFSVSFWWK